MSLQTFRRLLISKLQDEFENRTRNVESKSLTLRWRRTFSTLACNLTAAQCVVFFSSVYDKHDNPLTSEEEEQRAIAKIKMLGNIKFIGELGKLDLIHESILHKCIKTVRGYSVLLLWSRLTTLFVRLQQAVEELLPKIWSYDFLFNPLWSFWKRRRESSSKIWGRTWSASVR